MRRRRRLRYDFVKRGKIFMALLALAFILTMLSSKLWPCATPLQLLHSC